MPRRSPARACRRSFEPARLQRQLRSQAYGRLVPGPRPAAGRGRRGAPAGHPEAVAVANPYGGICA
jgi:hypothetical protein